MPQYNPPLRDMQFVLHEVLNVEDELKQMPQHADVDADTINPVLEEGGKFCSEVLFPLNQTGDREGCTLRQGDDVVTHADRASRKPTSSTSKAAGRRCRLRSGIRRPGPAASCVNNVLLRDAELGEPGVDDVPGPVARRLRVPARARHARAEEDCTCRSWSSGDWTGTMCLTEAALRHRPGHAAHEGRAAGRRLLRDHRHQDLHLGRRTRHG